MNEVNAMKEKCEEKINFFVDICHDLKTPLNVIMGAAKLIELSSIKHGQDDKTIKNIKVIERNCNYLLKLLNNIIDLARIDISCLELSPTSCNITVITENIVSTMFPIAEEKELELKFLAHGKEIRAEVDIHKIERVMLNLLSNAIRYTPKGGKVTVDVREEVNNTVAISVRDTGQGIPDALKEKIFHRFACVHENPAEYESGSGIGLSLAKSFVELHGGDIVLKSKPNQGSDFTVTLPVQSIKNRSFLNNLPSGYMAEQVFTE